MTTVGNLTSPLHSPGGDQILERWQVATDHLLSRVNDALKSVLGSEDGLDDVDGSVDYG